MKATLNKAEFYRTLSHALGVVDRKSTMPILAMVKIKAEGETLEIQATDLETSYHGRCAAQVEEGGEAVTHAVFLERLVKELPGLSFELESGDRHNLHLTQGEMIYQFFGLPPDQFPELPKLEPGAGAVEIDAGVLKGMLSQVQFSQGDDLQYNLNGILWEKIKDNGETLLRLVSTDGHRLTLSEKDHSFILDLLDLEEGGRMVPAKGVREIIKFLDKEEKISLIFTDQHLFLVGSGKMLNIRLMDKKYPEYRRIIPKETKFRISFDRVEFINALKRLSMMEIGRFKSLKVTIPSDGKEMLLTIDSPDIGQGQEKVGGLEFLQGEPMRNMTLGFNIRYLLEPLFLMQDEKVILEITDLDRPARLIGMDHPQFWTMVMPIAS